MRPYKGYTGTIEFDEDDQIFHGRIVGINDIFSYEATTAAEVSSAFRECVDEYIDFCSETGREPQKPFSGNLSLRMGADLHKFVFDAAGARAKSVNQWIIDTLSEAAKRDIESGETVVKS